MLCEERDRQRGEREIERIASLIIIIIMLLLLLLR